MSEDIVTAFADLFEGRRDAYGTETGGCVRVGQPTPIEKSWLNFVDAHLRGANPIGVYPMVRMPEPIDEWAERAVDRTRTSAALPFRENGWYVKWGCVDVDLRSPSKPSGDFDSENECHTAALNLRKVLKALGVVSWIERTRSHGRHVWVFASSWVSAATMRRALLVACDIAGCPKREVNPKAESLSEGQLGNYVRLVYPGGLNARPCPLERSIMGNHYDGFSPIGLEAFVGTAIQQRTSPETLQRIANKWKEPQRRRVIVQRAVPTEDIPFARLNRAGRSIFDCGPDDGDRSRGLAYLAYQARMSGLSPQETYGVLHSCPWNKFAERADEERRLTEIIERAWQ